MAPPRFDPEAIPDVLDCFVGELLGEGVARRTYALKGPHSECVLKVEYGERDWQNIAEWELWQSAPKALEKFLAPALYISRNGRALIMRRCEPCPTHLLPKRMPGVLGDLHADNIGLLNGKPVAMDYGRHLALAMTANAKVMKEVLYDAA